MPAKLSDESPTALILVVDDQPIILDLIRRGLARQGHDLITCTRGGEALQRLATLGKDLDLVIVDLLLPDIEGPTLIRRVLARNPDCEWLIISGWDQQRVRDACGKLYSEQRYLAKPFTLQDLQESVAELLN